MNRIRPLIAVAILLGAVLSRGAPASADLLPLDAEISIGREAAQIIEDQYPISTDAILAARVQRIGRRIAGVCGRPDLPFSFKVIDTPDINAFCLPGGFVYVFRGLLQGVPDDDALAFILAHEIAHAVHRHALRQFEKSQILRVVTAPLGSLLGALGRDLTHVIISRRFSRADELQADREGLLYTVRAGFDRQGGIKAMETLLRLAERSRHPEFLMSHPTTQRRKRALEALATQLDAVPPERPQITARPLPDPVWSMPPPSVPTPRFPLAIGDEWTYRLRARDGGEAQAVTRVVEAHPGRPKSIFRVVTEYPGGFSTEAWITTTASGVLARPAGEGSEGPWQTEWSWESLGETPRPEKVIVPAGEQECTRVIQTDAKGALVAEGWFAEGVGLVKAVWHHHGLTQELVSYRAAHRASRAAQTREGSSDPAVP
jgi:hypothetical protein